MFGEWCWIAIVAARGHSCLRTSFLEMKVLKLFEVALFPCCRCGDVFSVFLVLCFLSLSYVMGGAGGTVR